MLTTKAIGYANDLPLSDPASFSEQQVPVPELGERDILVETKAVSVNPVDVKLREAKKSQTPAVLGYDAAGIVAQVGSRASIFKPGDEVFYAGTIDRPGTNQQLHVVDERIVGRKPANLSFADAASLPLTAITAWEALFDRLGLTGESHGTMLVIGATGGVGVIMLQLAEALLPNVTVIATASTAERQQAVTKLGAEFAVNHHADLTAQVQQIAPAGVDWVFTSHSEGQISDYAKMVRPFGQIVAVDDGARDIYPLKTKCISWHWEFMFARPVFQTPDMIKQHELLDEVATLVEAGKIRPTTTQVLTPLTASTIRRAHQIVARGDVLGKVVVSGWE